ncbi:histone H1-binding protein [Aspergillus sp. HF37]|nr:histone H1-binding protein [Aspergillus sp. HF37]
MSGTDTEARAATPNNDLKDSREQLDQITTRAAAKDASKDFNTAADLYSRATEIQAELNGGLSPDNADLLFAYGKALYNVAVSKSDVLGSKVAGQPEPQSSTGKDAPAESSSAGGDTIQSAVASGMANKADDENEKVQESAQNKRFFQFTGDENFEDADSEEEEGGEEDGDEEEEDDFANAFETLDLARILYLKKLDTAGESLDKGKSTDMPSDVKLIKERLADTHDLQAEISLEAERFADAVTDLRKVLELRQALFPFEDPSVAECHYKLSLALEFASANKVNEETGETDDKVDEEMRKEAVTQMGSAIESCKIRMSQEQRKLDENSSTMDEDKVSAAKNKIANVKEIVADMEQRLVDLRQPPTSIKEQNQSSEAVLKGVLGQIVGQSPTEQKSKLDAASKGANDLSAFVKKKPADSRALQGEASHKRPAETSQDGDSKRARVDGPSQ